jgi:hypothetical protein
MHSKFKEKVAICYSCSGESYRESALRQIRDNYFDDDNLHYFIITDDKSYFDGLERKNLVINELSDFYEEFPLLEKYEALLDSKSKTDYATQFVEKNYLYSFSLMRFHLLQAYRSDISNVCMMCTDTRVDFNIFNDTLFDIKNTIHNAVSEWDADLQEKSMHIISDRLKDTHNLECSNTVRVLDAAGRFFVMDTLDSLKKLFDTWNDVIVYLYENDHIKHFIGSYVYHDEYILAPVYNAFGLNKREVHCLSRMFDVNHNQLQERFWRLGGSNPGIMEHTDYDEFLKINNLSNG